MKKVLIVGNFKSNKTEKESSEWFEKFSENYQQNFEKEVVICPSFTSLSSLSKLIEEKNLDIFLGAQDVSSFEEGPFTGEVSARQIKEFCKYSLVGHSERREKFSEDQAAINGKISNLIKAEIIPILCISEIEQLDRVGNLENCIIAYEPMHAIGTGEPLDPSLANDTLGKLRQKKSLGVLYGGSVDSKNISNYTSSFDGILVGTDSLDPLMFLQIINNA